MASGSHAVVSSCAHTFRRSVKLATIPAVVSGAVSLAGCQARQLGVGYSDKQAASVNQSWVTAAKSCWPALARGFTDLTLQQYLADPLHVRSAFAGYAAMDDADIRAIVTKPLMSAPAPDATVLANSQTPVLTRYQALSSSSSAQATADHTDSAAPADALCAIHSGQPVGFK